MIAYLDQSICADITQKQYQSRSSDELVESCFDCSRSIESQEMEICYRITSKLTAKLAICEERFRKGADPRGALALEFKSNVWVFLCQFRYDFVENDGFEVKHT